MHKARYEIDPHNRLVVNSSGGKGDLRKFRKVIDGRFKVGADNSLSYHAKSPLSADENIPHQLKLRGAWSLTRGHELRFTLDKQGRETFGDQITLQGRILDTNANSLLFGVTTKTKENTRTIYVLNLAGIWKADKFNRLSFYAKREKGAHDILTFNGVWEINKNNQIIYDYEKAELIRKKRSAHILTFKGHWDIKEKIRISYVLGGGTDSSFTFETGAGIFKEDYIKYEIAVGVRGKKDPVKKTLVLRGKWMLKKDTSLVFEIAYEDKNPRAIVFGADINLTGKDTVLFRLRNEIENKDLGITLELSHKILKGGGEAFASLLKSRRESAIYAGAAWRW